MQNRTALERIQMEIEIGIGKALLGLLKECALEIHTGRGINDDCECEFCAAKRRGTLEVHTAARNVSWATLPSYAAPSSPHADKQHRLVRSFGSCAPKYQDEWELKHNARERVRKQLRSELREIKSSAKPAKTEAST